jgi:hypothetical protein
VRHKQTPYEQYKILLEKSLTRSGDPLSPTSGLPPSITQSHEVRETIANDARRMATEIPIPSRQDEQIQRDLRLAVQQAEADQKRSERALKSDLKELFENSCRVRGRQLRSAAKGQSRLALEAVKETVAGDNEVHGNNLYKDTWWVAVKGGSKEGLEWFYGIDVSAAKVLLMAASVTYLVPNQNLVRTTKVKLPGKLTVQNGFIVDSNETSNMLF